MDCRGGWRSMPLAVRPPNLGYHACMIASPHDIGSATHPGKVRHNNEDRVLADERRGLFIVADGMGGHAAGEVASEVAVTQVSGAIAGGRTLHEAICAADAAIAAEGSERGSPGMATTIVALEFTPGRFELAWVGDSRAYRLRDGIEQLSTDHSYVQELVMQGLITAGRARTHPRRNIITRALGRLSDPPGQVDVIGGDLRDGDVFLLCSDGLTDLVDDDRLARTLAGAESAQQAADQLVDAAMAEGGTDNISVVVIRVGV